MSRCSIRLLTGLFVVLPAFAIGCNSGAGGGAAGGAPDSAALAKANQLDEQILEGIPASQWAMLPGDNPDMDPMDRDLRAIKAVFLFGETHRAAENKDRANLAYEYVRKRAEPLFDHAVYGGEVKQLTFDADLGRAILLADDDAEGALAILLAAFDDGFREVHRIEQNEAFQAVRALPGYQPLAEYHKANPPVIEPDMGPGS